MNSLSSLTPPPSAGSVSRSAGAALGAYFRLREAFLVGAATVLIALAFGANHWSHCRFLPEANPGILAEFAGARPYQLRVLMPFLAHWSARWSGLDVVRCSQLGLMAASVALFWVGGAYLRHFTTPRRARLLAPLLALPLLAFFAREWFYPYDVPAIAFNFLGLWLMARLQAQGQAKNEPAPWRHGALYLVAFFFATLNRETSALWMLAWVLTARDAMPRRAFWSVLGAQIGIWLAIRLVLWRVFASNPGAAFEVHWRENLAFLLQFGRGLDFKTGAAMGILVGLWAVGAATQRFQPQFLDRSRGVWWPFLGLMSLVGILTETRIYGEILPFLLSPALVGAVHWKQAQQLGAPSQTV